VGNLEGAQLAQRPYNDGGDGGREDQAGDAPERALGYGGQGFLGLPSAALADGLQGTHISGDEGEDGDAHTALREDSEEGQLEEHRWLVRAIGSVEEVPVEGAHSMGYDDQERCETAEALRGWLAGGPIGELGKTTRAHTGEEGKLTSTHLTFSCLVVILFGSSSTSLSRRHPRGVGGVLCGDTGRRTGGDQNDRQGRRRQKE
jgi:hypothetical protein